MYRFDEPEWHFDHVGLRRLRKEADLRAEALAAEVGCSAKTLNFYESGRTVPPLSFVLRSCDVLGCSPADLFTRERQRVTAWQS